MLLNGYAHTMTRELNPDGTPKPDFEHFVTPGEADEVQPSSGFFSKVATWAAYSLLVLSPVVALLVLAEGDPRAGYSTSTAIYTLIVGWGAAIAFGVVAEIAKSLSSLVKLSQPRDESE